VEVLGSYTLRVVALGAAILGATSGALGSLAVLRRQSLLGDALSHAALPGIALAFLITGSKRAGVIMAGAALAGWVGTSLIRAVTRRSRVPFDSALGMVLSVFFGVGLVLMTVIQKQADAAQAGLDSFLFGQAAALLRRDVMVMAVLAAVALLSLVLLWKELKLLCFDPEFGASLGFPVGRLDTILMALLTVAIVIGLQTVGVVLMSAMIVAPGAAARQWTDRLAPMISLAALIGLSCGVAGAVISSTWEKVPTGPAIVLLLSIVVIISIVLAPSRGLLWKRLRRASLLDAGYLDPVLMHLYALSLQHRDEPDHGHSVSVLATMSHRNVDVNGALEALESRGLAIQDQDGLWAPSALGRREARRLMERKTRPEGTEARDER
jgi:manganese/zinc/iron transport system permease protein